MATIAPVVVSLALWLVTRSVFALVFAALGPAVAVASLADARIQSRRRSRREQRRFASELEAARVEIADAHDRERAALHRAAPSGRRLVAQTWTAPEQWLATLDEPVVVALCSGERPSSLSLDGLPATSRSRGPAQGALRDLERSSRVLAGAPLTVDARHGIGIVGPAPVAEAAARSIVVQLAALLPPRSHSVVVETGPGCAERWRWLEGLPHVVATAEAGAAHTRVRFVGAGSERPVGAPAAHRADRPGSIAANAAVSVAQHVDDLPTTARIVVRAVGSTGTIEQHPDATQVGVVNLDHVGLEQARSIAATLSATARRSRLGIAAALPDGLAFDDRGEHDGTNGFAPGPATGLDCAVAATTAGPLRLDLVAHGPHAVVGGTTGSGKSELLTAWILAIAHAHSPRRVSVLLVDFKGGSAFAGLAGLPHCVGMITDLDAAGARRALESLAAELRRRERHLAGAGAKSVDALGEPATGHEALPRLVIVVDEFAAMVAGFPELHALFADIAARGRSLGVHLVLCTQRPAGVIRDSVLANSALRVSLRVNNRADSLAVIGTDAAAALALHPPGRAYVCADGDDPVLAQFPLVTPRDIAAVRQRWAGERYRPHRPWLDPLPGSIAVADLPAAGGAPPGAPHRVAGLPFGLLDDPAQQAQPVAHYEPRPDGNLLVVGGAGSGKTTLLDTLGRAGSDGWRVESLPNDVEGAWDTLVATLAEIRSRPAGTGNPRSLLLVDDLDVLLGRFPDDYEGAVLELVTQGLREGPGRDIHFVLATQRLTAPLQQAAALCGSRLLLALPNRQEHILAGGDGVDFAERTRPGLGRWRGLAVQVARGDDGRPPFTALDPRPPAATVLDESVPVAVVSARPDAFAERLGRALPGFALPGAVVDIGSGLAAPAGIVVGDGRRPSAVVGSLDAWQAQWGALQAARPRCAVVVDGLGAGDFRVITRQRALPPPLSGHGGLFWLWRADGSVVRARLPGEDAAPTIPQQ